MTDIDTCDYCNSPLRPVLDEYGDQRLKHGFEVVGCKSGHWFVLIDRDLIERPPAAAAERIAA